MLAFCFLVYCFGKKVGLFRIREYRILLCFKIYLSVRRGSVLFSIDFEGEGFGNGFVYFACFEVTFS